MAFLVGTVHCMGDEMKVCFSLALEDGGQVQDDLLVLLPQ